MFIWIKLRRFKNIEINLRVSGSAALDLAYVASGRLDGFFQKKLKYLGYSCRINYN